MTMWLEGKTYADPLDACCEACGKELELVPNYDRGWIGDHCGYRYIIHPKVWQVWYRRGEA